VNMLVRSSAAAAAAVAATVSHAATAMPSPHPSGPTAIDLLWKQRQETKREYSMARRRSARLRAELERRIPKPHPSITYSKENDADGLKFFFADREPHSLHGYIWSREIKSAIKEIDLSRVAYGRSEAGDLILQPDRNRPLTDLDEARRKRLSERLEISLQYEEEIERVKREIGLSKLTRKLKIRSCRALPILNAASV
jgi:hypothetical protein